jgi:hypothetical protein
MNDEVKEILSVRKLWAKMKQLECRVKEHEERLGEIEEQHEADWERAMGDDL